MLKKISRTTAGLKQSHYMKSILKVVTGTSSAQLIAIVTIPFLARIYPAESFGLLGVFVALSNVSRVLFTLRYDFAIPNAKTGAEANSLFLLTVILSFVFTVLFYVIIYSFPIVYLNRFEGAEHLLPIMFFVTCLDGSLTFLVSRSGHYGLLSTSRVMRAISISGIQIAVGLSGEVDRGLLYGILLGEMVAVVYILLIIKLTSINRFGVSLSRVLFVARKHRNNPIYLFPGHLLNIGSSQLPMIVIEKIYGPATAGLLYMAIKMVSLPGQLVGAGVFKVFTAEAAKLYNKIGECYELVVKTLLGAIVLYSVMFVAIDLIAYFYIGKLLGKEWEAALTTIFIYSVIEFVPAVFFTISGIWTVTNNQKLNLKYQIGRSLFVMTGLVLGVMSGEYYGTLIIYGVFRSLSFLFFLVKCVALSKGQCRNVVEVSK